MLYFILLNDFCSVISPDIFTRQGVKITFFVRDYVFLNVLLLVEGDIGASFGKADVVFFFGRLSFGRDLIADVFFHGRGQGFGVFRF